MKTEQLREVLVKHGIVAAEAIDDPEGYDHGVLLARIDAAAASMQQLVEGPTADVLALKAANATRWRDRDDSYWLARLMQEVGELGSSLVGDHKDPPEHELRQIASISMNWLEKRAADARPGREEWRDCGCGMGKDCHRATKETVSAG